MKKIAFLSLVFMVFACGEPGDPPESQLAPTAAADPSSDHAALFRAATEAVLEVQSVQYRYTLEGMSVMEDTVEFTSEGSVFLVKGTNMDDASIHVDYTMTVLPEDTTITGTVVSNGGTAAHLSASQELYVFGEAEDGGAAIVLRDGIPQGAVVREFLFTSDPFGAELNAQGYRFHDQEERSGVLCHVITVDMPPYASTWWISTETFLPVANSISVWSPDSAQGMEYTVSISDVVLNSQPPEDTFQLTCPENIEARQVFGSITEGSPAPPWSLMTPGGERVSLEDLRGRVVVMDFWATWCGPCRVVMPSLQELHETHGDRVTVVGINVWESGDPAAFMEENGYTYTMVLNGDDVASEYMVEGIPTFYVIAPDGTVAFHAVGADPANDEALREIVGTLLEE